MKIIKVTKEYFELEDGTQVEHAISLTEVPSLEEFQIMYNEAEKIIRKEDIDNE